MNLSTQKLILGSLSLFILGGYSNAIAAPQKPSDESTMELFYPEIVTPSESKGLTPHEKEKLQRDQHDVMDQVPGF